MSRKWVKINLANRNGWTSVSILTDRNKSFLYLDGTLEKTSVGNVSYQFWVPPDSGSIPKKKGLQK